jgi:hypothetical protein
MLCVLDVAALDDFSVDLAGDVAARREWFDLLIHHAAVAGAVGRLVARYAGRE